MQSSSYGSPASSSPGSTSEIMRQKYQPYISKSPLSHFLNDSSTLFDSFQHNNMTPSSTGNSALLEPDLYQVEKTFSMISQVHGVMMDSLNVLSSRSRLSSTMPSAASSPPNRSALNSASSLSISRISLDPGAAKLRDRGEELAKAYLEAQRELKKKDEDFRKVEKSLEEKERMAIEMMEEAKKLEAQSIEHVMNKSKKQENNDAVIYNNNNNNTTVKLVQSPKEKELETELVETRKKLDDILEMQVQWAKSWTDPGTNKPIPADEVIKKDGVIEQLTTAVSRAQKEAEKSEEDLMRTVQEKEALIQDLQQMKLDHENLSKSLKARNRAIAEKEAGLEKLKHLETRNDELERRLAEKSNGISELQEQISFLRNALTASATLATMTVVTSDISSPPSSPLPSLPSSSPPPNNNNDATMLEINWRKLLAKSRNRLTALESGNLASRAHAAAFSRALEAAEAEILYLKVTNDPNPCPDDGVRTILGDLISALQDIGDEMIKSEDLADVPVRQLVEDTISELEIIRSMGLSGVSPIPRKNRSPISPNSREKFTVPMQPYRDLMTLQQQVFQEQQRQISLQQQQMMAMAAETAQRIANTPSKNASSPPTLSPGSPFNDQNAAREYAASLGSLSGWRMEQWNGVEEDLRKCVDAIAQHRDINPNDLARLYAYIRTAGTDFRNTIGQRSVEAEEYQAFVSSVSRYVEDESKRVLADAEGITTARMAAEAKSAALLALSQEQWNTFVNITNQNIDAFLTDPAVNRDCEGSLRTLLKTSELEFASLKASGVISMGNTLELLISRTRMDLETAMSLARIALPKKHVVVHQPLVAPSPPPLASHSNSSSPVATIVAAPTIQDAAATASLLDAALTERKTREEALKTLARQKWGDAKELLQRNIAQATKNNPESVSAFTELIKGCDGEFNALLSLGPLDGKSLADFIENVNEEVRQALKMVAVSSSPPNPQAHANHDNSEQKREAVSEAETERKRALDLLCDQQWKAALSQLNRSIDLFSSGPQGDTSSTQVFHDLVSCADREYGALKEAGLVSPDVLKMLVTRVNEDISEGMALVASPKVHKNSVQMVESRGNAAIQAAADARRLALVGLREQQWKHSRESMERKIDGYKKGDGVNEEGVAALQRLMQSADDEFKSLMEADDGDVIDAHSLNGFIESVEDSINEALQYLAPSRVIKVADPTIDSVDDELVKAAEHARKEVISKLRRQQWMAARAQLESSLVSFVKEMKAPLLPEGIDAMEQILRSGDEEFEALEAGGQVASDDVSDLISRVNEDLTTAITIASDTFPAHLPLIAQPKKESVDVTILKAHQWGSARSHLQSIVDELRNQNYDPEYVAAADCILRSADVEFEASVAAGTLTPSELHRLIGNIQSDLQEVVQAAKNTKMPDDSTPQYLSDLRSSMSPLPSGMASSATVALDAIHDLHWNSTLDQVKSSIESVRALPGAQEVHTRALEALVHSADLEYKMLKPSVTTSQLMQLSSQTIATRDELIAAICVSLTPAPPPPPIVINQAAHQQQHHPIIISPPVSPFQMLAHQQQQQQQQQQPTPIIVSTGPTSPSIVIQPQQQQQPHYYGADPSMYSMHSPMLDTPANAVMRSQRWQAARTHLQAQVDVLRMHPGLHPDQLRVLDQILVASDAEFQAMNANGAVTGPLELQGLISRTSAKLTEASGWFGVAVPPSNIPQMPSMSSYHPPSQMYSPANPASDHNLNLNNQENEELAEAITQQKEMNMELRRLDWEAIAMPLRSQLEALRASHWADAQQVALLDQALGGAEAEFDALNYSETTDPKEVHRFMQQTSMDMNELMTLTRLAAAKEISRSASSRLLSQLKLRTMEYDDGGVGGGGRVSNSNSNQKEGEAEEGKGEEQPRAPVFNLREELNKLRPSSRNVRFIPRSQAYSQPQPYQQQIPSLPFSPNAYLPPEVLSARKNRMMMQDEIRKLLALSQPDQVPSSSRPLSTMSADRGRWDNIRRNLNSDFDEISRSFSPQSVPYPSNPLVWPPTSRLSSTFSVRQPLPFRHNQSYVDDFSKRIDKLVERLLRKPKIPPNLATSSPSGYRPNLFSSPQTSSFLRSNPYMSSSSPSSSLPMPPPPMMAFSTPMPSPYMSYPIAGWNTYGSPPNMMNMGQYNPTTMSAQSASLPPQQQQYQTPAPAPVQAPPPLPPMPSPWEARLQQLREHLAALKADRTCDPETVAAVEKAIKEADDSIENLKKLSPDGQVQPEEMARIVQKAQQSVLDAMTPGKLTSKDKLWSEFIKKLQHDLDELKKNPRASLDQISALEQLIADAKRQAAIIGGVSPEESSKRLKDMETKANDIMHAFDAPKVEEVSKQPVAVVVAPPPPPPPPPSKWDLFEQNARNDIEKLRKTDPRRAAALSKALEEALALKASNPNLTPQQLEDIMNNAEKKMADISTAKPDALFIPEWDRFEDQARQNLELMKADPERAAAMARVLDEARAKIAALKASNPNLSQDEVDAILRDAEKKLAELASAKPNATFVPQWDNYEDDTRKEIEKLMLTDPVKAAEMAKALDEAKAKIAALKAASPNGVVSPEVVASIMNDAKKRIAAVAQAKPTTLFVPKWDEFEDAARTKVDKIKASDPARAAAMSKILEDAHAKIAALKASNPNLSQDEVDAILKDAEKKMAEVANAGPNALFIPEWDNFEDKIRGELEAMRKTDPARAAEMEKILKDARDKIAALKAASPDGTVDPKLIEDIMNEAKRKLGDLSAAKLNTLFVPAWDNFEDQARDDIDKLKGKNSGKAAEMEQVLQDAHDKIAALKAASPDGTVDPKVIEDIMNEAKRKMADIAKRRDADPMATDEERDWYAVADQLRQELEKSGMDPETMKHLEDILSNAEVALRNLRSLPPEQRKEAMQAVMDQATEEIAKLLGANDPNAKLTPAQERIMQILNDAKEKRNLSDIANVVDPLAHWKDLREKLLEHLDELKKDPNADPRVIKALEDLIAETDANVGKIKDPKDLDDAMKKFGKAFAALSQGLTPDEELQQILKQVSELAGVSPDDLLPLQAAPDEDQLRNSEKVVIRINLPFDQVESEPAQKQFSAQLGREIGIAIKCPTDRLFANNFHAGSIVVDQNIFHHPDARLDAKDLSKNLHDQCNDPGSTLRNQGKIGPYIIGTMWEGASDVPLAFADFEGQKQKEIDKLKGSDPERAAEMEKILKDAHDKIAALKAASPDGKVDPKLIEDIMRDAEKNMGEVANAGPNALFVPAWDNFEDKARDDIDKLKATGDPERAGLMDKILKDAHDKIAALKAASPDGTVDPKLIEDIMNEAKRKMDEVANAGPNALFVPAWDNFEDGIRGDVDKIRADGDPKRASLMEQVLDEARAKIAALKAASPDGTVDPKLIEDIMNDAKKKLAEIANAGLNALFIPSWDLFEDKSRDDIEKMKKSGDPKRAAAMERVLDEARMKIKALQDASPDGKVSQEAIDAIMDEAKKKMEEIATLPPDALFVPQWDNFEDKMKSDVIGKTDAYRADAMNKVLDEAKREIEKLEAEGKATPEAIAEIMKNCQRKLDEITATPTPEEDKWSQLQAKLKGMLDGGEDDELAKLLMEMQDAAEKGDLSTAIAKAEAILAGKEARNKEKEEQEKLAKEKEEQEKLAREEEQEKLAKENEEQEKLAKEKEEQEKLAKENEEQEKLAKEKEEREKLSKEKEEREKLDKEKEEQEKLSKEKEEQEKLSKEKEEQEKKLKEEQERLAKEDQEKKLKEEQATLIPEEPLVEEEIQIAVGKVTHPQAARVVKTATPGVSKQEVKVAEVEHPAATAVSNIETSKAASAASVSLVAEEKEKNTVSDEDLDRLEKAVKEEESKNAVAVSKLNTDYYYQLKNNGGDGDAHKKDIEVINPFRENWERIKQDMLEKIEEARRTGEDLQSAEMLVEIIDCTEREIAKLPKDSTFGWDGIFSRLSKQISEVVPSTPAFTSFFGRLQDEFSKLMKEGALFMGKLQNEIESLTQAAEEGEDGAKELINTRRSIAWESASLQAQKFNPGRSNGLDTILTHGDEIIQEKLRKDQVLSNEDWSRISKKMEKEREHLDKRQPVVNIESVGGRTMSSGESQWISQRTRLKNEIAERRMNHGENEHADALQQVLERAEPEAQSLQSKEPNAEWGPFLRNISQQIRIIQESHEKIKKIQEEMPPPRPPTPPPPPPSAPEPSFFDSFFGSSEPEPSPAPQPAAAKPKAVEEEEEESLFTSLSSAFFGSDKPASSAAPKPAPAPVAAAAAPQPKPKPPPPPVDEEEDIFSSIFGSAFSKPSSSSSSSDVAVEKVANMVTEEIAKLNMKPRMLCGKLDPNRTGFLTRQQLLDGIAALKIQLSPEQQDYLLQKLDPKHTDRIGPSKLRTLYPGSYLDPESKGFLSHHKNLLKAIVEAMEFEEITDMRSLFMKHTKNEEKMSKQHLSSLVQQLNPYPKPTQIEMAHLIKSANPDGNGLLTFDDFYRMMVFVA